MGMNKNYMFDLTNKKWALHCIGKVYLAENCSFFFFWVIVGESCIRKADKRKKSITLSYSRFSMNLIQPKKLIHTNILGK